MDLWHGLSGDCVACFDVGLAESLPFVRSSDVAAASAEVLVGDEVAFFFDDLLALNIVFEFVQILEFVEEFQETLFPLAQSSKAFF